MESAAGQTKEWFKDWANDYDRTLGKIKRHHQLLDLTVKISKVKDGERVLDIGIGTGLTSLKFLEAANCTIVGIDYSHDMMDICKDKLGKLGLTDKIVCRMMDAVSLDFPNESFDIVASTVALHHIKDKYPVIKAIRNILKSGGRFVLGDLDMDTTGKLTDPKRLQRVLDYLMPELIEALKDGGVEGFSRMYDNGKKHILNDGEYCISFEQWADICKKAGFSRLISEPIPGFERFRVLCAYK
jgi:phosphatidylethanolamine/phosphatidyl-N-methylethanolamine N-methyltransferase